MRLALEAGAVSYQARRIPKEGDMATAEQSVRGSFRTFRENE